MNIDVLKYFSLAAKTGNFSRAAKDLHITQPTLTIAIKRLEESLGSTLFERSKKGVKLTKAGQTALVEIEAIIRQWEDLQRTSVSDKDSVGGTLRIGCHSAVAQYTLPQILPRILKDYPKLKVQLQHDLSRRILNSVQNSDIDIGLVVNPPPADGLVLIELAQDEVTIWKKTDLKNTSILMYDPNLFQTHAVLDKLRKKKIVFSQIIESSDLNVIESLLQSGAGHALLPKRVAFKRSQKNIVESFPDIESFRDRLYLVFKPSLRTNPAAKVVVESLKNEFNRKK